MKRYSLRKLFRQSFEGHEGRPGKRGGSLPRSDSSSGGGQPSHSRKRTPTQKAFAGSDMKALPKDMEAEYKRYKKMPMKELQQEHKRFLGGSSSGNRETIIFSVFLERFGADKINAWTEQYSK